MQLLDRLRAHPAGEVLLVAVEQLAPDPLVVDELLGGELRERGPHTLQVVDLGLAAGPQLLDVLVVGLLEPLDVRLAGRRAALLELGELLLELLEPAPEPQVELLLHVGDLGPDVGLELGLVLVATLGVNPGDQVRGKVDDLLEALGRDVEEVPEPARDALEVPDVGDGGGQLDVAHPLASDLRARDLDAAALADDPLEPDALVLAAVALPVLGRAEDLLAEQPVLLRLERPVVDRLRLLHLAVGPHADLVRGGQGDAQLGALVDVVHAVSLFCLRGRR